MDTNLDNAHTHRPVDAVVFDLGGVLVDWNPRHLYRHLFGSDILGMERFLTEVCGPAWNECQDAGRDWNEAIAEAIRAHPEHADLIRAFRERWTEMLGGEFEDSVAILAELRAHDIPIFALTNWARDTFLIAEERYPFLQWFKQVMVSGREGMAKPNPAIFRLMLQRFALSAERTLFIDDSIRNVEAASKIGLKAILYRDAGQLRRELAAFHLPVSPIPRTLS
jgi:2-haloacid dehalogenase